MLSDAIDNLHSLRERIATLAKVQAERELDGRVLRLTVETEKCHAGASQTAAEKAAKVDARYLAHERESIKTAYDRMVLEADAEAERFGVELQLALLKRESVGAV